MVTPAGYLRAQDLPEDSLSSYPSTYNFIGIKGLDTGTPTLFRGTLPAGGGSGSSLEVRYEGENLTTAATSLNFTGAGVTATNTSGAVTIDIPSGVTSVGLSVPSIFTVSGSPVTSSGTLGFSLPSLGMRNFLASPINSTGVPDFRPIHTLDLPSFLDNNARVGVGLGGTLVGTRRRINFIEGSNVTLSVSDDNINEAVNVTINSSGLGSGLANIPVSDEGSPQGNATSFNFTGNVVATVASNVATVNIPAISASDEGTPLTANVTGFNFVGAGITATQSGGLVTVNVPGGGGGGISDGDKGDITVSGSGSVWTIDNDIVTFPKLQNIATARLLGRSSSGAGDIEEIQIGSGLSLSGGTLTASGGGGGSEIQGTLYNGLYLHFPFNGIGFSTTGVGLSWFNDQSSSKFSDTSKFGTRSIINISGGSSYDMFTSAWRLGNFNQDFTLSFWNYATAMPNSRAILFSHFLTNANYDLPHFQLISEGRNGGGQTPVSYRLFVSFASSGNVNLTASSFVGLNTWNHIIVRYDASTRIFTLTINGSSLSTSTPLGNFTEESVSGRTANLVSLFGNSNGGFNTHTDRIDQLCWWYRRLSDNECNSLYNSGNGVNL